MRETFCFGKKSFLFPCRKTMRGLNENSNGLLRKDGLPKQMDFNQIDEEFIQSISHYSIYSLNTSIGVK